MKHDKYAIKIPVKDQLAGAEYRLQHCTAAVLRTAFAVDAHEVPDDRFLFKIARLRFAVSELRNARRELSAVRRQAKRSGVAR
jgi:hypothetical protein